MNISQKPLSSSRVASRWAFTLLLTWPLFALPAQGQFTGPALPITTPVNPPLVETTDPAILYPAAHEIQLDAGDVLNIKLYGATDYNPVVHVGHNGFIQIPLISPVNVRGLTVPQAEQLIASRLVAAGMYRDPQVSIVITESPNQVVTIIGEVHGVVPVGSGKRLFDVIAAAGGFTPSSSHTITINRAGVAEPIVVSLGTDPAHSAASNVPVFAHDTVVVPRVGVVYLLGSFKAQAAIPITQSSPLTLMKAASMGGGIVYGGKLSDLRIIRTEGQTRTVVKVDVGKVMDGKIPDPVLQADDIVFLPSSAIKEAIAYGGIGTLLGLASIMLYAFH